MPHCVKDLSIMLSPAKKKGVGKVVQGNRVPFLRTGEEIPFEAPQRGMFIRVRKCHKGAPINYVETFFYNSVLYKLSLIQV